MAATVIIVPVPQAQPAADPWRRRYTEDGAAGMPPHITLLSPFVEETLLDAEQIRAIGGVVGAIRPFGFVLRSFAEFPASDASARVLYLSPEPVDPFVELTKALVRAFPSYPPFGGAFETIIPHLTITTSREAPLQEVRDRVAPALPIQARATEARVMRYGVDGWRTKSILQLGRQEQRPSVDPDLPPPAGYGDRSSV